MALARLLMVMTAALMMTFCGGEGTNGAGTAAQAPGTQVGTPGRSAAGASDEMSSGQSGEPETGLAGQPGGTAGGAAGQQGPAAGSSGPRVALTPSAPYYFAHARFVLARDAQGRPLGLRVEKVLARGRVALAGIQVGDLIHSIDLVPMDDPATFDRAVRIAEDIFRDRRPQHFVVTRQGRKMGLMPLGPLATEPQQSPRP